MQNAERTSYKITRRQAQIITMKFSMANAAIEICNLTFALEECRQQSMEAKSVDDIDIDIDMLLESLNEMSQGELQEIPLEERKNEIRKLLKSQDLARHYLELTIFLSPMVDQQSQESLKYYQDKLLEFQNKIQETKYKSGKDTLEALMQKLESLVQDYESRIQNFINENRILGDKAKRCDDELEKLLNKMREKHKDVVQECENELKESKERLRKHLNTSNNTEPSPTVTSASASPQPSSSVESAI